MLLRRSSSSSANDDIAEVITTDMVNMEAGTSTSTNSLKKQKIWSVTGLNTIISDVDNNNNNNRKGLEQMIPSSSKFQIAVTKMRQLISNNISAPEIPDPLDPIVPTGGMQSRLTTVFMAEWTPGDSEIEGYNQLAQVHFPHAINNTHRVIYQESTDNGAWYRLRLGDGRVGRTFHHDPILNETQPLLPHNTRETGEKYEARVYATLYHERLSNESITRMGTFLSSKSQDDLLRWLDQSQVDLWETITKEDQHMFTQAVLTGSNSCTGSMFGLDPVDEPSGIYVMGGQPKNIPPLRQMANNTLIVTESKSDARKFYSHHATFRAQSERMFYHSTSTIEADIGNENINKPKNSWQIYMTILHMSKIVVLITVVVLAFGLPLDATELVTRQALGKLWLPKMSLYIKRMIRNCICKTRKQALLWIANVHEAAKNKNGQMSYSSSTHFASHATTTPKVLLLQSALTSTSTSTSTSPILSDDDNDNHDKNHDDDGKEKEKKNHQRDSNKVLDNVNEAILPDGLSSSTLTMANLKTLHVVIPDPRMVSIEEDKNASSTSRYGNKNKKDDNNNDYEDDANVEINNTDMKLSLSSLQSSKKQKGVKKNMLHQQQHNQKTVVTEAAQKLREQHGTLFIESCKSSKKNVSACTNENSIVLKHGKDWFSKYIRPRNLSVQEHDKILQTLREKMYGKDIADYLQRLRQLYNIDNHAYEKKHHKDVEIKYNDDRRAKRARKTKYRRQQAKNNGKSDSTTKIKVKSNLASEKDNNNDDNNDDNNDSDNKVDDENKSMSNSDKKKTINKNVNKNVKKKNHTESSSDDDNSSSKTRKRPKVSIASESEDSDTSDNNSDSGSDSDDDDSDEEDNEDNIYKRTRRMDEKDRNIYIEKYRREQSKIQYMEYTIGSGICPNFGGLPNLKNKHLFMGEIIGIMIATKLGVIPVDNSDHHLFRRYIESYGLIADQERQLLCNASRTGRRTTSNHSRFRMMRKYLQEMEENEQRRRTKMDDDNNNNNNNKSTTTAGTTTTASPPISSSPPSAIPIKKKKEKAMNTMSHIDQFKRAIAHEKSNSIIHQCWVTCNWTASRTRQSRPGVIVPLMTNNQFGTDAASTMLSAVSGSRSKMAGARGVNSDQEQFIDPTHTPDGPACGKHVHRAYSTISKGTPPSYASHVILQESEHLGVIPVDAHWDMQVIRLEDYDLLRRIMELAGTFAPVPAISTDAIGGSLWKRVIEVVTPDYIFGRLTNINVNGSKIAWIPTENLPRFHRLFKLMKGANMFWDRMIRIWDRPTHNSVEISTDAGQLMKLFIDIEHYDKFEVCDFESMSINELINANILVWLGADQASDKINTLIVNSREDMMIQLQHGKRPTHMVIHPCLMFDSVTNQMPYQNSNSGPRSSHHNSMVKTAMTPYLRDLWMYQTRVCRSLTSQKPLVSTTSIEVLPERLQPYGSNVRMIVMPLEGYNVEDPYIVNARVGALGGLKVDMFTVVRYTQKRTNAVGSRELLGRPDKRTCRPLKNANYQRLQPNGLPPVGTKICYGDPIMGITSLVRAGAHRRTTASGGSGGGGSGSGSGTLDTKSSAPTSSQRRRDCSIYHRGEPSIVVSSELRVTADGIQHARVVLRSQRDFIIGDKCSSRHGQKGVSSETRPDHEMPFSVLHGWTADVIVSPHAFPTRLTPGQTREIWHARARSLAPDHVSSKANAFESRFELDKSNANTLLTFGLNPQSVERMRNAITGQIIECPVYVGFTYLELLPHIAADKAQARSEGPRQLKTNQPVDGGRKGGGLRLGYMERTCIEAYAAAKVLYTRLKIMSDETWSFRCLRCGRSAIVNFVEEWALCRKCKTGEFVHGIHGTRSGILLSDEQMTLGSYTRWVLDPTGDRVTNINRHRFNRHLV
jgi:DNA-directed RNA polymerase beta subunit